MLKVAAGAAALLALSAGTANAAVAAPVKATAVKATAVKAVTWKSGLSKVVGVTTAVTGVKVNAAITEFAFVAPGAYDAKPVLYTRVNSGAWHAQAIPSTEKGEAITAATAITANHVIAFTTLTNISDQVTGSRVLSYYEGKWSVLAKFSKPISDGTVLSARNIWVFGPGAYHYNGKSWKEVATATGAGSGASATSAWVISGTAPSVESVEHIIGDKVTSTANLASLILYNKEFEGSGQLDGVYATSATTAYAIGNGHTQDAGGPLSVLEFNGKSWKRVASFGEGNDRAVSSDGAGGLYIGASCSGRSPALLLHYAKGSSKLVSVSVPGATIAGGVLDAAANIPGTTAEVLGGYTLTLSGSVYARLFTTN
jgi:hypothetical protein